MVHEPFSPQAVVSKQILPAIWEQMNLRGYIFQPFAICYAATIFIAVYKFLHADRHVIDLVDPGFVDVAAGADGIWFR